jgi:hypothetical protein
MLGRPTFITERSRETMNCTIATVARTPRELIFRNMFLK